MEQEFDATTDYNSVHSQSKSVYNIKINIVMDVKFNSIENFFSLVVITAM